MSGVGPEAGVRLRGLTRAHVARLLTQSRPTANHQDVCTRREKLSLGNRPSALREYSAFRRLRKNISCARSCLASMGPRGSSSNSPWTCSATISATLIRPGAPHATAGVGAVAAPVGQFHPNHALIAAGGILLGRLGLAWLGLAWLGLAWLGIDVGQRTAGKRRRQEIRYGRDGSN